ncbi:RNA polymerase sigma factor [Actinocrispum sp. NPDC049592]|uniref:RNA polymerase sigma factor n=1 Tax=Actinocrispum sp. NPDC049592 TaxID=3154835 RepID=UPI003434B17C
MHSAAASEDDATPVTSTADLSADGLADALRRAKNGEDHAFRLLYRAIQPGLLRYLRVLAGADAEDVASEAWLQVARDLPSFRGELDGFRGWVTTIGRNRAMDHLRHLRRQPATDGPLEELTERPGSCDTEQSVVDAMSTDGALALIAKLPRDQAEAVLLRVVVGLDAKGAAQVLGKRPGAVRTAAHRGLRKLAELLENQRRPREIGLE